MCDDSSEPAGLVQAQTYALVLLSEGSLCALQRQAYCKQFGDLSEEVCYLNAAKARKLLPVMKFVKATLYRHAVEDGEFS